MIHSIPNNTIENHTPNHELKMTFNDNFVVFKFNKSFDHQLNNQVILIIGKT